MSPSSSEYLQFKGEAAPDGLQPPRLHLLYHELTPGKTDYSYALLTEVFKEHLALFCRLREQNEAALQPEITFDDGHLSNFEHALPLLSSAGCVARFFITAGWTANRREYMNWDQLRQLQRAGQGIGAHGWSHALLTHCSEAELDHELTHTRLTLEDKLGSPVTALSLPGGRFDARVLRACQRAGYTQVFTSAPRAVSSVSAPLIGRLNLRSDVTVSWLERVLQPESKLLRHMERNYRLKQAAQRTLGDSLYARLWGLLNRAGAQDGPRLISR